MTLFTNIKCHVANLRISNLHYFPKTTCYRNQWEGTGLSLEGPILTLRKVRVGDLLAKKLKLMYWGIAEGGDTPAFLTMKKKIMIHTAMQVTIQRGNTTNTILQICKSLV